MAIEHMSRRLNKYVDGGGEGEALYTEFANPTVTELYVDFENTIDV